MEHELRALRAQLAEKTRQYLRLQKEVCLSSYVMLKRLLYEMHPLSIL